jgi:DNA polymerase-3 subunit delta
VRYTAAQFERALLGPLAALYVLHGDDPLLVFDACAALRSAAATQGFSEREILIANANFDWQQVLDAAQSLSLFATQRLIELRIPNGKPGKKGADALVAYCKRLPADTVTVVSLPVFDWQGEKSAWFQALEQAGVVVKFATPSLEQLPNWIAGRLRRHGLSASEETLVFLAERVEGNLLAAQQEIEKLALLFPRGAMPDHAVRQAVLNVTRYDVEQLGATLLGGDLKRFTRILFGLRAEGEALPLVLWCVTRDLRQVASVQGGVAAGRPAAQVLREQRLFGPRQGVVEEAARRLRPALVRRALCDCALVDRVVKGLAPGDAWHQLLRLALRMQRVALTI